MENLGIITTIMTKKNILIIGNLGYVGAVLVPHLRNKFTNSRIIGFDIGYFSNNLTTNSMSPESLLDAQFYGDVRNFPSDLLNNIEAVIYLAAISNDPIGNLYENPTLDINFTSAIHIAKEAKNRGVKYFSFASSCSVYGFTDATARTEKSATNPLTAYAKSKIFAEDALSTLASEDFFITCLRFATACGFSTRLRLDLVLNDFIASAIALNRINILSNGLAYRPLIHVKDMAKALEWSIDRQLIHGNTFQVVNVGNNKNNFQVKELAMKAQQYFENLEVTINHDAPIDHRSYEVDFTLYEQIAPNHQATFFLDDMIKDIIQGLNSIKFTDGNFRKSNLIRLNTIQYLIKEEKIDADLKLM
jgi:nucleoside-diphosphate-sugar epimerase